MTDQWTYAPQQQYQPHPPATWTPPVTGFVLALLIPVVGIFICHSEKKQAAAIGQDNALARAGFVYSMVALIIGGAGVLMYLAIGAVFLARFANLS